jgi:hypothetical protein
MPARRLALSITAEGPVGGDRILAAKSSTPTDILGMKSSDSSDLARMGSRYGNCDGSAPKRGARRAPQNRVHSQRTQV